MRGIYSIENTLTSTFYYGQSKNIKRRLTNHRSALRGGYHKNDHLQASWNKYGEVAFKFHTNEIMEDSDLTTLEKRYITEAGVAGLKVFNIADPEKAPCHTPETREKMRQAMIGRISSIETRRKLSEALKGNKNGVGNSPSLEERRKTSERMKGNKLCVGTKNRLGQSPSIETRKKISLAKKGKKHKVALPVVSEQVTV